MLFGGRRISETWQHKNLPDASASIQGTQQVSVELGDAPFRTKGSRDQSQTGQGAT